MRRTAVALMIFLALAFSAVAAEEKSPSYSFKFSGYFKGDLAYDRARVTSGNYALSVLDEPENDLTSITARESRFGLDFAWKENEIQTDARFEFDFYGLGASENKPGAMLRHAYLQVTKGRWSLLAGQTSDIISPLVPKTVNYTVCWDQGNIGYRRPQLRITAWANASERVKLSAAVGAFRSLGGNLDNDAVDDGADAGMPTFQGRLALAATLPGNRKLEIGFSGHYGREEYVDTEKLSETFGKTKRIESWSAAADLKVAFCECFEFAGEFFAGQDLGAYYGGVGQTVNILKEEIASMGAWGQLSVKPLERAWLNIGYGFDDPHDNDFVIPEGTKVNQSFIDMNSVILGSIMYSVTSTVTAMLEVSQLTTDYIRYDYDAGAKKGTITDASHDDLRVQFAMKAAIK